ncbi:MAG TPA: hypothetical protein VMZ71_14320, partial [Gemmataceae bacterium]|nr:hypothetical protein [Gemmataceae bacterium]
MMFGVRVVVVCGSLAAAGFAQQSAKTPADADRVIAQLVEELGDPVYTTRENAQRELWKRGSAAIPALEKATRHDDP